MSFIKYLGNGFGILFFNKQSVADIANDPDQKRKALTLTAIMSVIGGLALTLIFSFILLISAGTPTAGLFGNLGLPGALLIIFLICAIAVFLFTLMGAGIYHLLARAFGGSATIMAFYATLLAMQFALGICGILATILSIIPYVGWIFNLVWTIYSIAVLVFVIREVYQITTGKAIFVALIIPIVVVILVIGVIAYFGVLSPVAYY